MPSRTLPNLGLKAFYDLGEDGWKAEQDLGLLKLSVLTQGGVISKVAATPGAPTEGDVHIFDETHPTNANDVAIYDDATWKYVTPNEGWLLYNRTENYFEIFDGTTWAELATGGGGLADAPSDGTIYGRQDASWVAVGSGGGGGAPTFAQFKHIEAAGTGGGNATTAAWTKRTLNTESLNDIAGASIASSVITLPAGTYKASGGQVFYRTNYTQLRLQDTTNAVTLASSVVAYVFDDLDGHGQAVPINGVFTLSAEADVEFQYYCSSNENVNSLGLSVAPIEGQYADLLIEKVA